MRTENVMYFTDKEEDFANLLIEIGTKRNVAKVLVFLANTPEATSRAIERGTDLRQPEVSIAMRQLDPFDWIDEIEEKKPGKGRPNKVYSLKVGFKDIIAHFEKEQKKEIDDGIVSIKRVKELVHD